jgi:hypothetical protein
MILPAVFAAFLLGLVLEAVVINILDRRAIAKEAAFWEELRAAALDGYGAVFDWADCPELGCDTHEPGSRP